MKKKNQSPLLERSMGGLTSVIAALICIVVGLVLGLLFLLILDAQHAWKDGFVPIIQAGFRNVGNETLAKVGMNWMTVGQEIVEAALRRSGEWAGLDAAETGNAPDGAYRYALYEAHGAARVPYAYGILGQQRLDGEWKTVAMIAPFSNDSAATAHLARLCTGQQLEPIHILDVIHDFMNTEARTL